MLVTFYAVVVATFEKQNLAFIVSCGGCAIDFHHDLLQMYATFLEVQLSKKILANCKLRYNLSLIKIARAALRLMWARGPERCWFPISAP